MARPWFTALEPPGHGAHLSDSALPDRANALAERLGAGPAGWAVDMGARMAAAITAAIPQLAVDAVAAEVHKGCEAVALGALAALAHDDDVTFAAMSEVLAGPTEVVARGIGIEHMLRSIHVAHATAAGALLDAAERVVPEPRRFTEMRRINQILFDVVDVVTERMAAEYSRAQQEWMTSSIALRMEVVEELLNGTAVSIERATRILNYDLSRWHSAVIAWTDASAPAEAPQLKAVAQQSLLATGCTSTLVLPVGAHRVWAWGSRTAHPPEPFTSKAPPPEGLHLATGMPGAGIEGFRDSHRQATDAARVAAMSTRPERVFRYQDHDIVAMLSADPTAAREFVGRELGDLAGGDGNVVTMRQTLKAYLDRDRSLVRTAADLHVARNTVAYRVQRAEHLRGRPIAERRLQLHAALTLAEELGDAMLRPPTTPLA